MDSKPHIFLSFNVMDRGWLDQVRDGLLARKLNVWAYPFDNDNLDGWTPQLDAAIERETSGCTVLVGPRGLGAVQREELFEALRRRISARGARPYTLVPVLLPGATRSRNGLLPELLRSHHWVEFAETVNDSSKLDELAARLRGDTSGRRRAPLAPSECPYRGLEHFDVEHADIFFGRDVIVDDILSAIRGTRDERGPQRFVTIVGVSGSGKSSLARAGVLAALTRQRAPNPAPNPGAMPCTIVRVSPGDEPIHSLARALAEVGDDITISAPFDPFVEAVRHSPRFLDEQASVWARGKSQSWRLVILMDGFEAVLTASRGASAAHPSNSAGGQSASVNSEGSNAAQRLMDARALVAALIRAASTQDGRVTVLLTMRDDFLARVVEFEGLSDAIARSQFVVGPLSPDELREAIVQPAQMASREVESGLTEAIVADVGGSAAALPFVQLVLKQIWNQQAGLRKLTLEPYRAKRLAGALDDHAERVWAELGPPKGTEAQQSLARRLLLRLVEPGEEASPTTKRRVRWTELQALGGDESAMGALVEFLSSKDRRVLVTSGFRAHTDHGVAGARDESSVEIVHDALLRGWRRLAGWIEEDREWLTIEHELRRAASAWDGKIQTGSETDASDYWSGRKLERVEGLAASRTDRLIPVEIGYLRECRRRADELVEREHQRRRELDRLNQELADRATQLAEQLARLKIETASADSLRLVRLAEAAGYQSPQRRILYAVESLLATDAVGAPWLPESQQALIDAVASVRGTPLVADEGRGATVTLSPDGSRVAAVIDRTARIWDVQAARPANSQIDLPGYEAIFTIAFSPDGGRLAMIADDTARVWDLRAADPLDKPIVLSGDISWLGWIAFSADGARVAIATSEGESVSIWDVHKDEATAKPIVLNGRAATAHGIDFSPDGRWVVTSSEEDTVGVWDLRASDRVSPLLVCGEEDSISCIAFSSDGKRVSVAHADGIVHLWDLSSSDPAASRTELRGHIRSISSIKFSPGGTHLATVSADDTVLIWNLRAPGPSASPIALRTVDALFAFSPEGTSIVTSPERGDAAVWDLASPDPAADPLVLRGLQDSITSITFSPDGGSIAIASAGGMAYVWNLTDWYSADTPIALRGHEGSISAIKFSRDGRRVVTAGSDGTARVWELQAPEPAARPIVASSRRHPLQFVAFDSDGGTIAMTSDDRAVLLWQLHSTDTAIGPIVLAGHEGGITSIGFNSSSGRAAAACGDGTVRVWNLEAGSTVRPIVLRGSEVPVTAIHFSPDGSRIAAIGTDKTARVWSLDAPDLPVSPTVLGQHETPITSVCFGPDGGHIATVSENGTARVWDLNAADPTADMIFLDWQDDPIRSLTFSADGRRLTGGSRDGIVYVWDLQTADLAASAVRLPGSDYFNMSFNEFSFSPNGRHVATTSTGGHICVWDLAAVGPAAAPTWLGRQAESFGNGSLSVSPISFSPNGDCVATRGPDGTARVWNLLASNPAANPIVLRGDHGHITSFEFSPDGKRLAIQSRDATASIWDLDPTALVRAAWHLVRKPALSEDDWRSAYSTAPWRPTFPNRFVPTIAESEIVVRHAHHERLDDPSGAGDPAPGAR